MELGSSGAKQAGYVILSAIAMMIGLSLIPTIIGQVSPVIIDNAGQLEATISQFIPTGLALALLVIAFGVSVGIAVSSHQSAETKPVAIIIAVIVLVIGIGLITPIDTARDAAVQAVAGTTGSVTCTAAAPAACAFGSYAPGAMSAADRGSLIAAFSLTDTILAYTVVGYVLSLLTAAFGLANMGTGGVMSRQAVKRLGRA